MLREQMIFSLPEFVKKSGKGVSISSTTLTRFNFLHKLMHKSVHKTLKDIRKDAQWCSGREAACWVSAAELRNNHTILIKSLLGPLVLASYCLTLILTHFY